MTEIDPTNIAIIAAHLSLHHSIPMPQLADKAVELFIESGYAIARRETEISAIPRENILAHAKEEASTIIGSAHKEAEAIRAEARKSAKELLDQAAEQRDAILAKAKDKTPPKGAEDTEDKEKPAPKKKAD